jgi:hypothetical protein
LKKSAVGAGCEVQNLPKLRTSKFFCQCYQFQTVNPSCPLQSSEETIHERQGVKVQSLLCTVEVCYHWSFKPSSWVSQKCPRPDSNGDLRLRRPALCPLELRGHFIFGNGQALGDKDRLYSTLNHRVTNSCIYGHILPASA